MVSRIIKFYSISTFVIDFTNIFTLILQFTKKHTKSAENIATNDNDYAIKCQINTLRQKNQWLMSVLLKTGKW